MTLVLLVLGLAGSARAQSGQVLFRGTVTVNEAHDVVPVCYGDCHVTVSVDQVMEDPNAVLVGLASVQVCYAVAANLAAGTTVEVYGYYWGGGGCPRQYCNRVQIRTKSDYITPLAGYGGGDWIVLGNLMYAVPSGNVGIGTEQPRDKLHVVGNLLLENTSAVSMRLVSELGQDAGLSLTSAGVGVNLWEVLREGQSADLVIREHFPYPPFSGAGLVVKAKSGYVGLGVAAPAYHLDLPNTPNEAGQARANAWKTYSSGRWKTNIRPIENAMDKVLRLRGVYFNWREQGTRDIGLIAEEVGQVVPEVVDYEANGTDARSLAYDRLVALLVEAMKEQQVRIAQLEQTLARNENLEQRLRALERLVQQRQDCPAPTRDTPQRRE